MNIIKQYIKNDKNKNNNYNNYNDNNYESIYEWQNKLSPDLALADNCVRLQIIFTYLLTLHVLTTVHKIMFSVFRKKLQQMEGTHS